MKGILSLLTSSWTALSESQQEWELGMLTPGEVE